MRPTGDQPDGQTGGRADPGDSNAPDRLTETSPPAGPGSSFAAQVLAKRLPALVRLMRMRAVRLTFVAIVLALLSLALVDQAGTLWAEVQHLSAPVLILAFVAGLAGLISMLMVWRSLLADLGSKISLLQAWRIMFIGQLAKYVPGSIWPVLAQAEVGADRGIPRSRSAVSLLLCYVVMTCTGGIAAAVTLPFAAGSFERYFWTLFAVPVAAIVLSPPVLNRCFGLLLRQLGLEPLQYRLSVRGLSGTVGWALTGWLCYGVMTYILVRQLSGHSRGTLLLSIGAYALSWVVGFVAVFVPAGAGVREAVMVGVLSTHTTGAVALTVALVTRALAVISDAVTGAIAAGLVGRHRLERLRAGRASTDSPGPAC